MLDRESGAISFPEWSFSFSPTTTRSEFMNCPLFPNASVNIETGPYCSWNLAPATYKGETWLITVHFCREYLTFVDMLISDPRYGSSWDTWSMKGEMERKARHEKIISEDLGDPPYEFSWGTVGTDYDPRGGCSSVTVRFIEKDRAGDIALPCSDFPLIAVPRAPFPPFARRSSGGRSGSCPS